MDLIGLVIDGEGVHHNINAQSKGHFSLAVAAGSDGVLPVAEGVSSEGAEEVVGIEEDAGPLFIKDGLEIIGNVDSTHRTVDQVETLMNGVAAGKGHKVAAGKNSFNLSAGGLHEGAFGEAFGGIDEEKPSGEQVSAKIGNYLVGKGIEAAIAAHKEGGMFEEFLSTGLNGGDLRIDLDAGAGVHFLEESTQSSGAGIVIASLVAKSGQGNAMLAIKAPGACRQERAGRGEGHLF